MVNKEIPKCSSAVSKRQNKLDPFQEDHITSQQSQIYTLTTDVKQAKLTDFIKPSRTNAKKKKKKSFQSRGLECK